jgi:hypothetical protein
MHEPLFKESRPDNRVNLPVETMRTRLLTAQTSDHAAPWFCRVAAGPPIFYIVAAGACRLWPDGTGECLTLDTGDLVVLLRGQGHSLQHCRQGVYPRLVLQDTKLIRVRFVWEDYDLESRVSELPAVVHFRGENSNLVPWMARTIRAMMRESTPARPATRALIDRLAWMVFAWSVSNYSTASRLRLYGSNQSAAKSDSRISGF